MRTGEDEDVSPVGAFPLVGAEAPNESDEYDPTDRCHNGPSAGSTSARGWALAPSGVGPIEDPGDRLRRDPELSRESPAID